LRLEHVRAAALRAGGAEAIARGDWRLAAAMASNRFGLPMDSATKLVPRARKRRRIPTILGNADRKSHFLSQIASKLPLVEQVDSVHDEVPAPPDPPLLAAYAPPGATTM